MILIVHFAQPPPLPPGILNQKKAKKIHTQYMLHAAMKKTVWVGKTTLTNLTKAYKSCAKLPPAIQL